MELIVTLLLQLLVVLILILNSILLHNLFVRKGTILQEMTIIFWSALKESIILEFFPNMPH